MPTTLNELFWVLLSAVMGLLITAGFLIYKRDWTILDLRFKGIEEKLEAILKWQDDREP